MLSWCHLIRGGFREHQGRSADADPARTAATACWRERFPALRAESCMAPLQLRGGKTEAWLLAGSRVRIGSYFWKGVCLRTGRLVRSAAAGRQEIAGRLGQGGRGSGRSHVRSLASEDWGKKEKEMLWFHKDSSKSSHAAGQRGDAEFRWGAECVPELNGPAGRPPKRQPRKKPPRVRPGGSLMSGAGEVRPTGVSSLSR